MQIRVFESDYCRQEFYSIMGKYFAEEPYIKELPYMRNKPEDVWFVAMQDGEVIGFGAVKVEKKKALLEHSYIEEAFREKGIWKQINQMRIDYAMMMKLPMEVITKENYLKEYWESKGFNVFRKNGQYYYLRKEILTNGT